MYQAPIAVWNQIAETQPVKTEQMKKLFSLSETAMDKRLENEAAKLKADGFDPEVIAAIQLTLPLLVENVAISRYIQQSNQLYLRNSLPELTTVSEATRLAIAEYNLSHYQAQKLTAYLNQETKRLLPPEA